MTRDPELNAEVKAILEGFDLKRLWPSLFASVAELAQAVEIAKPPGMSLHDSMGRVLASIVLIHQRIPEKGLDR